jgi:hypothetical protein
MIENIVKKHKESVNADRKQREEFRSGGELLNAAEQTLKRLSGAVNFLNYQFGDPPAYETFIQFIRDTADNPLRILKEFYRLYSNAERHIDDILLRYRYNAVSVPKLFEKKPELTEYVSEFNALKKSFSENKEFVRVCIGIVEGKNLVMLNSKRKGVNHEKKNA